MSQRVLLNRAGATPTTDAKDSGRWITTENGNHVHLDKNGNPDKGNPKVIKAMKSGKSKPSKKSDKPAKAKADKSKEDLSLSAHEYWEKYKKSKPHGVYGNTIYFDDGNYSTRSREITLPKKGETFANASNELKSDMRAILKGLTKNKDNPAWKDVAKKFVPAAKAFYKGSDLSFVHQDLNWCEKHLKAK